MIMLLQSDLRKQLLYSSFLTEATGKWKIPFLTKFKIMKLTIDIFSIFMIFFQSALPKNLWIHPGNIRLDEDVLNTSWRRLLSSTSGDVLIKTNIFALVIRLQKTSWSRPIYSSWPYVFKTSCKNVFKTSSRRLADVLKTSSRRPKDIFKTSCQDVFKTSAKTSSRHLQDVLKTSSRGLQDILKTSCKDAFKIFWRRIIRLNCLLSSRICLGHTS